MRIFFYSILGFSLFAAAQNDPPSCVSVARLAAQQKARLNGRGPSHPTLWDAERPSVSLSENGGLVRIESVSKGKNGQSVKTTVDFLRRPDGSWAAQRTVQDALRILETASWVQDAIPFTRKTSLEHQLETEPIRSASLPADLASFQKLHSIPDVEVHRAYHDLRNRALSTRRPYWRPREGIKWAMELSFTRLDLSKLKGFIREGALAFGYSQKSVESHVRGSSRPRDQAENQDQTDYLQLVFAMRSLEDKGFASEMNSIRAELLEGISETLGP
jgi:hypothetical protein